MNTLAVMCIALTRHKPSRTPLRWTAAATSGVIFTKSIRAGMLNFSSSRCDFIAILYGAILMNGGAYNTTDETIRFSCDRFACADARCVDGVSPVSSAGARAAIGAADDDE